MKIRLYFLIVGMTILAFMGGIVFERFVIQTQDTPPPVVVDYYSEE